MNLIFIGPPGSGKGTQGQLLKKLGYEVLSTGDLLRAEIAKKTKLGQKIDSIISKGNLVSDEMAVELIKSNLGSGKYIIDGIPRTIKQAKLLEEFIGSYKVIFFYIDLNLLEQRLIHRYLCPKCEGIFSLDKKLNCPTCKEDCLIRRKDDEISVINTRLEVYKNSIKEIIDYYQENKKLIIINANQNVEEVHKDILTHFIV